MFELDKIAAQLAQFGGGNRFSNSNAYRVIADNEANFGIIGAVDNTDKNLLANSRFSYVGDDGRLLQYPLDLGTDSTHYMIFNIYETDGAELKDEDNRNAVAGEYATFTKGANTLLEEEDKKRTSAANMGMFGMMTNNSFFMNMAASLTRQADQLAFDSSTQTINAIKARRKLDELDIAFTNKDKRESFGTKVSTTRVNEPGIVGKDSIVLYMPQKINSMNMIDYDLESFATTKAAQKIYAGLTDWSVEGGISALPELAGIGVSALMKAVGSVTQAVGVGSPMDVLKVFGRVAINPQKEMLFNAPAPRKYEFAFEFAPRNEDESLQVRNIIQLFKYHAFPATSGSAEAVGDILGGAFGKWIEESMTPESAELGKSSQWYRMPAEFQFEYMHIDKSNGNEVAVENHWLNRAERCVLTEVNVDYSGAGAFQTFENGAPTHITLTLTFAEARLITQEHIAKGY